MLAVAIDIVLSQNIIRGPLKRLKAALSREDISEARKEHKLLADFWRVRGHETIKAYGINILILKERHKDALEQLEALDPVTALQVNVADGNAGSGCIRLPSHPVLTLHTRYLGSDDELLSAYIHEQFHWYLEAHRKEAQEAEQKLRKLYLKVPVGYPDGGQDEESTYLHLIDCYLEIQADRRLMGPERTAKVISSMDHYTWVYKTIIRDEGKIANVVNEAGLTLKDETTRFP